MRRIGLGLTALLVLVSLGSGTVWVSAESANAVANGGLEAPYAFGVAGGWSGFDSGGEAAYRYSEDTSSELVFDGTHSQLLEISTEDLTAPETERYVGVYQVTSVVPEASYMFSLYGLVRSTVDAERAGVVQVGFDLEGGTDPLKVREWIDLPWQPSPLDEPGEFDSYAVDLTATAESLTVFVRLWDDRGEPGTLSSVNLDAISLLGPVAESASEPEGASDPEGQVDTEVGAAGGASSDATDAVTTLPKTGGGSTLPLVGVVAALTTLGLAGLRTWRQR